MYIIEKQKTFSSNFLIHIYINRINHKLLFKIKDGYKLQLQTLGTIKFFGNNEAIIDRTKSGKNVPSLVNIGVVLVQYSLVDNKYYTHTY